MERDPWKEEMSLEALLESKTVVTIADIIHVSGSRGMSRFTDVTEVLANFAQFYRTLERKSWNGKALDLVKDTRKENVAGDGGMESLVGLLEEGYLKDIGDLRLWIVDAATRESMRRFCNLFQSGALNDLRTLHLHLTLSKEKAEIFWEEFARSLSSAALGDLQIFNSGHDSCGNSLASILANQFALGHLRSLRWLVLDKLNIGDDGVVLLAKSFADGHAEKLEKLGLARNNIRDKGIESLVAAFVHVKSPKLRFLDLSGNPIESKGLTALANAFKSGHLSELETVRVDQLTTRESSEAGMVELRLNETENFLAR